MRRWRRFVPLNRFQAHSIVRHDADFFFAADLLQMPPVMVEVAAFNSEHCRRLHQAYQDAVVAYEATTAIHEPPP